MWTRKVSSTGIIDMPDPLMDHFASQWKFVRDLTRDLLESIPQEEMTRSPIASVGPWWKQFRHIGRVQENYLNAIESGAVKFGFEDAAYRGGESKAESKNISISSTIV
jgi:uncharacterized damage-inducible protein DinB